MRRGGAGMLVLAALAVGMGACRDCPTRAVNRSPVISSVVAFPTTLGVGDSTLVTVYATDPDGDALVYDWVAYHGLQIKGARSTYVYNTPDRSHVFYLQSKVAESDTAFIECVVRDRKGGSDGRWLVINLAD